MDLLWIALISLAALISGILMIRLQRRRDRNEKSASSVSLGTLQEVAKQLDRGIALKVQRHFDMHFIYVDTLFWQVANEGIMAKFKMDETPHFVYYTLDGEWKHTLLNHRGEVLPKELSDLVRAKFSSYTITSTEEVLFAGCSYKTYILYLLNGNNYKEIVIENNELIVVNEKEL